LEALISKSSDVTSSGEEDVELASLIAPNSSVPAPAPLHEVKELEALISRASDILSHGGGGKKLLQERQVMEKPIMTWLAGLAKGGVVENYNPTEEEVTWIQMIF
jgi:hypothetical protein